MLASWIYKEQKRQRSRKVDHTCSILIRHFKKWLFSLLCFALTLKLRTRYALREDNCAIIIDRFWQHWMIFCFTKLFLNVFTRACRALGLDVFIIELVKSCLFEQRHSWLLHILRSFLGYEVWNVVRSHFSEPLLSVCSKLWSVTFSWVCKNMQWIFFLRPEKNSDHEEGR